MTRLAREIAEIEAHAQPPRPDRRALAVLARLAAGETTTQAADHEHIPQGTVHRLLAVARDVLGAETTTQAVVFADRRGLIPPLREDTTT